MESEFPPLPSPGRSAKHPASASLNRDGVAVSDNGYRGVEVASDGSKIIHGILSRDGDAILEYVDADSRNKSVTHYRWQVSSRSLMENSPFFSALLDPNKFSEGRRFVENRARSKEWLTTFGIKSGNDGDNESPERLPLISLNLIRLTGKHRIESLELFLKVLLSAHDADLNAKLGTELLQQPVPVIAGLIEVADLFSSADVVNKSLGNAKYRPYIRGFQPLDIFNASLLKLSEERLRQVIYIAMSIQHGTIFRVATHALILLGSIRWLDAGTGLDKSRSHRWSYFENGLEEELYYRRQCIMNTITDLQAHFLRAYGALEDDVVERSKPQTKNNMLVTAVSPNVRSLQCRWGFDNSRACDSFHLGEMIRFFSMRTKTIFLGSTLIDPGYDNGFDEEQQQNGEEQWDGDDNKKGYDRAANIAFADVLSVTASLRQIPDYQIDPNHTGCGIRRRLLPLLDCIDGFIGHRRAVIGVADVMVWKWSGTTTTTTTLAAGQRKRSVDSWKSSGLLSRAEEVDIRGAKLVRIRRITPRSSAIDIINRSQCSVVEKAGKTVAPGTSSSPSSLPLNALQQAQEEARLFFTALKRNWES